MKPIAIIPARAGSKGVPMKNIMPFCGLPLIAWSIKQAKAANLPVYVSTEDEDIARCAGEFGAIPIPRPSSLSADDTPTAPVLQHAAGWLNDQKVDWDTMILLQATSPLRTSDSIGDAIVHYMQDGTRYLFSCYLAKAIVWENGAPPCRPGQTLRRQDMESKVVEHGMVYIYDDRFEPLGEGRLTSGSVYGFKTPRWQSHEIDDPEDVEVCEFYMRKKGLCSIRA
jgi:CMP-N,N'-diacetyllegionaminic acid synthase